MEPKDTSKVDLQRQEDARKAERIAAQWTAFATKYGKEAFEEFMDYMRFNREMLISYAEERVMPSPVGEGEQVIINAETSSSLLQNARGIGIVKTYVEGYYNPLDVVQNKKITYK